MVHPVREQEDSPTWLWPCTGLVVRASSMELLDVSLTWERGNGLCTRGSPQRTPEARKMMTSGGPDKKVQQAGVVCICLSIPFFSLTPQHFSGLTWASGF